MKSFFLFLLLLVSTSMAQELNCKVTVNYEGLPVVNRELLTGFAQIIEEYMNKTRFLDTDWEGEKIDCTLNIFFTSASDERHYVAQAFIGSQRPIFETEENSQILSILDNSWSFMYEKGQGLYGNQAVYDPITSFLDFYAYLIIGMDLDTWYKLGGTQMFQKAFSISNLGASSSYSGGWITNGSNYTRRGIVEDLLNAKYSAFRESIHEYHFDGLDMYNKNILASQNRMVKTIDLLENMHSKMDIKSVFVKVFFDAKHGEMIDRLRTYPNKDIFKKLKKIDPAHISKYDEVLK